MRSDCPFFEQTLLLSVWQEIRVYEFIVSDGHRIAAQIPLGIETWAAPRISQNSQALGGGIAPAGAMNSQRSISILA